MRTVGVVLLLVVALILGAALVAAWRWRDATARLVARLDHDPGPGRPATVSLSELDALPAPVARYLRLVLQDGQPIIRRARFRQEGEFLVRPPEGWRPFRATQEVATLPPGFVWDATIRMAPGIGVWVRDGFVGESGSMRASLMGLMTMVAVEGTSDIAAGALHRYLAEAVWFPTALLPSQGVRWEALDDSTARALLSAGAVTVSLDFSFGPDGLVRSVFTDARMRDVDGRGVPTPWRGRWYEFGKPAGWLIPVRGEVEWILPEGPQPYWRGRIVDLRYEMAGPAEPR